MMYDENVFKLIEKAKVEDFAWFFQGSGLLFKYIDDINLKLSEYEDMTYISKPSSDTNIVLVFLKLNSDTPKLTPENIEFKKQKFFEHFENVANGIINENLCD